MTNGSGIAPLNFNGAYALASYASNAGAHFAQTTIGELLIFDRRLSDEERLGIESYLGEKWAASPVPIPATAWLLGSTLVGLGAARRRRSSSQSI